jgi:hypothetical protein
MEDLFVRMDLRLFALRMGIDLALGMQDWFCPEWFVLPLRLAVDSKQ